MDALVQFYQSPAERCVNRAVLAEKTHRELIEIILEQFDVVNDFKNRLAEAETKLSQVNDD